METQEGQPQTQKARRKAPILPRLEFPSHHPGAVWISDRFGGTRDAAGFHSLCGRYITLGAA